MVTVVVTISRHSSVSSPDGSAPITSATKKTPPRVGTAMSNLNNASATDWTRVVCQFAAARSAPCLSVAFREEMLSEQW